MSLSVVDLPVPDSPTMTIVSPLPRDERHVLENRAIERERHVIELDDRLARCGDALLRLLALLQLLRESRAQLVLGAPQPRLALRLGRRRGARPRARGGAGAPLASPGVSVIRSMESRTCVRK